MTISITSIADTVGTITPVGLNVETDLVSYAAQADHYIVEGYVDLANMAGGDTTIITEYIAIDGTNFRIYWQSTQSGVQANPAVRFHGKLFPAATLYKVTVKQTAGTARGYYEAFQLQVMSA
jgi:hypothetical protein